MSRLRALSSKEVLKILFRFGFVNHHQRGSHIHLVHPMKSNVRIIVPYHSVILSIKTLKSIIQQANLTSEEKEMFYR